MTFDIAHWNTAVGLVLIILMLLAFMFIAWKYKTSDAQKDAINTWREVSEAQDKKIEQLDTDYKELKNDYKELHAKYNQLVGENNILKNVKPSLEFEKTVKLLLDEMKTMAQCQVDLRKDYVKHAKQDDKRFTQILKAVGVKD